MQEPLWNQFVDPNLQFELHNSRVNTMDEIENINHFKKIIVWECANITTIQNKDNIMILRVSRNPELTTISNLKNLRTLGVIDCEKLITVSNCDNLVHILWMQSRHDGQVSIRIENVKNLRVMYLVGVNLGSIRNAPRLTAVDGTFEVDDDNIEFPAHVRWVGDASLKNTNHTIFKYATIRTNDKLEYNNDNVKTLISIPKTTSFLVVSQCDSLEKINGLLGIKYLKVRNTRNLSEIRDLLDVEYLYVTGCMSLKLISNCPKLIYLHVSDTELPIRIERVNSLIVLRVNNARVESVRDAPQLTWVDGYSDFRSLDFNSFNDFPIHYKLQWIEKPGLVDYVMYHRMQEINKAMQTLNNFLDGDMVSRVRSMLIDPSVNTRMDVRMLESPFSTLAL